MSSCEPSGNGSSGSWRSTGAELERPATEGTGDPAVVGQHQADHGTETHYREDAVGRIEQLERELAAVERPSGASARARTA